MHTTAPKHCSGPCNVLSHTRLWSQSAVMWPHLAAGRAVEGFYLHDIQHPDGYQVLDC